MYYTFWHAAVNHHPPTVTLSYWSYETIITNLVPQRCKIIIMLVLYYHYSHPHGQIW